MFRVGSAFVVILAVFCLNVRSEATARPRHVRVSFVLRADPNGVLLFTDGYPVEPAGNPPYRRSLYVEGDVTSDVMDDGVVRLRFVKPFDVRTEVEGVSSTLVLNTLDVSLSLPESRALERLSRADADEVVVSEGAGDGDITLIQALVIATNAPTLQPLAENPQRLPEILALREAKVSFGYVDLDDLARGRPIPLSFNALTIRRVLAFDAVRSVLTLDSSQITMPRERILTGTRRHARDADVRRYLDLHAKVMDLRRRLIGWSVGTARAADGFEHVVIVQSEDNVLRPDFGRGCRARLGDDEVE